MNYASYEHYSKKLDWNENMRGFLVKVWIVSVPLAMFGIMAGLNVLDSASGLWRKVKG
jgi:hypothetical protein